MLTAVKNQMKVTLLSVKYALMREMINKVTFFMNIVFMILNNASFIIQWIILYSIKDDVGGYSFNQILLLWAISAAGFGFSHFFFKKAYSLSDAITTGKLDSYLVQPKNVLISAITSQVEVSAIGDILYGYILLAFSGISLINIIVFTVLAILSGIVLTNIAVILGSLSFWISRADMIAERGNGLMINFSTYPDGIFKGVTKFLLFTLVPVGILSFNATRFFSFAMIE